jgi:hypothetical protein
LSTDRFPLFLNKHANHLEKMSQTKIFVAIVICLMTHVCAAAIPTFWQEIPTTDLFEDSLLLQYYQRHAKLPTHQKITVIELNLNALQEKTMSVLLEGRYLNVNQISFEHADQNTTDKSNGNEFQIWFGASVPNGMTNDGMTNGSENRPDFYFTVRGDKVAGKFFWNHTPYTLMPLYKNYHLLIEHHPQQLPDVCASDNDNSFFEAGVKRFLRNDKESVQPTQDYTLRVLLALSQGALSRLHEYSGTYSATHFAQNALQESNLAYLRGEIPFRLQMERVTYLSYSEAEIHRDLNNLAAEQPPFDQIKQLRTQYSTDVQVLVRNNEDPIAGLSTIRGLGLTEGKAFCVMSADGMVFTPFALKHQIEHLVKNWTPNDDFSRRSSYLSSLRIQFKQSFLPFGQYHAFARHLNWYSNGQQVELAPEVDSAVLVIPLANAVSPTESGLLLPHWDLIFLEKNTQMDSISELPRTPYHENARDPFEGMPIRMKPNPTSGKTVVEYAVAADKQGVTMRISTLTGQFIQFLVDDGEHPFGQYALQWDAGWLPNGVYLCTLRAGGQTRTTRIVVSH